MQVGKQILTSVPQSKLAAQFSGAAQMNLDRDGRIFIDRNPDIFKHVIDYLTTDKEYLFNTSDQNIKKQLELELEFWKIPD